jgi:hypothetical protein
VIVCYVDIGGIDDHYCLNFLFSVQWVMIRGDCLFCWYWCIWWSLLFTVTFHLNSLSQKESVNSNGDQFHQNQQNKQSSLNLTHWTGKRKVGIDDHYCFNFLFCVQWAKIRDDCLLCWFWWNWWPLLFKLSFLC